MRRLALPVAVVLPAALVGVYLSCSGLTDNFRTKWSDDESEEDDFIAPDANPDVEIREGAVIADDTTGAYLTLPGTVRPAGPPVNAQVKDGGPTTLDGVKYKLAYDFTLVGPPQFASGHVALIFKLPNADGSARLGIVPGATLEPGAADAEITLKGAGDYQFALLSEPILAEREVTVPPDGGTDSTDGGDGSDGGADNVQRAHLWTLDTSGVLKLYEIENGVVKKTSSWGLAIEDATKPHHIVALANGVLVSVPGSGVWQLKREENTLVKIIQKDTADEICIAGFSKDGESYGGLTTYNNPLSSVKFEVIDPITGTSVSGDSTSEFQTLYANGSDTNLCAVDMKHGVFWSANQVATSLIAFDYLNNRSYSYHDSEIPGIPSNKSSWTSGIPGFGHTDGTRLFVYVDPAGNLITGVNLTAAVYDPGTKTYWIAHDGDYFVLSESCAAYGRCVPQETQTFADNMAQKAHLVRLGSNLIAAVYKPAVGDTKAIVSLSLTDRASIAAGVRNNQPLEPNLTSDVLAMAAYLPPP